MPYFKTSRQIYFQFQKQKPLTLWAANTKLGYVMEFLLKVAIHGSLSLTCTCSVKPIKYLFVRPAYTNSESLL